MPNKYHDLSQFQLPPGFRGRPAWVVQLWWLVQSTLFGASPQFMYAWRRWLLRLFGARVGRGVLVRPSARITYPWKLTLGNYAWVGDDVELYTLGEIVIEEHAVISQRSYLCTGTHDMNSPTFAIESHPIHIRAQAWVASDVFIAPGVTVGCGAVVGVRSTVLHELPEGMLCYGNPAKPIRPRKNQDTPRE